jgi:hypothetical protein
LAARFAFVRPQTLVQEALAGRFPHEKLYALINNQSSFLKLQPAVERVSTWHKADDGSMQSMEKEETQDERVSRFVKAFPEVDVFLFAWGNLCELTIHTLNEPSLITDTVAAFNWHGRYPRPHTPNPWGSRRLSDTTKSGGLGGITTARSCPAKGTTSYIDIRRHIHGNTFTASRF